jgi:hypothetical protein
MEKKKGDLALPSADKKRWASGRKAAVAHAMRTTIVSREASATGYLPKNSPLGRQGSINTGSEVYRSRGHRITARRITARLLAANGERACSLE